MARDGAICRHLRRRVLTDPAAQHNRQHSDPRGYRLRPVLPSLRRIARLRRQSQYPRPALQYGTRVAPRLTTAPRPALGHLASLGISVAMGHNRRHKDAED